MFSKIILLALLNTFVTSHHWTTSTDRPPRILLVQVDSRPLIDRSRSSPAPDAWLPMGFWEDRRPFWSMSAGLHYLYALRHGYDYVSVELNGPCQYERNGKRVDLNQNWCKVWGLKSARDMLPDYDWYLYTDSDCFYRNEDMSFTEAMDHLVTIHPNVQGATLVVSSEEADGCLKYHLHGRPNGEKECRANSGIMFWSNTPLMPEMLKYWWDQAMDGDGYFRQEWPFEQGILSGTIIERFPGAVAVIPQTEGFLNRPTGSYLAHFWSGRDGVVERAASNADRILQILNSDTFQMPSSLFDVITTLLPGNWTTTTDRFAGQQYVANRCLDLIRHRPEEASRMPNLSPWKNACNLFGYKWPKITDPLGHEREAQCLGRDGNRHRCDPRDLDRVIQFLRLVLPRIQILRADTQRTKLTPDQIDPAMMA